MPRPGRAVAEEPGGDLGVDQVPGHDAARPLEDLEVLAGRVHDARRLAVEQAPQRGDVDDERVDEHDLVPGGQLQEGELRVVGALAVELGVERVGIDARRLVDEGGELSLGVDPAEAGFRGPGRYGSIPVDTGSPASTHAVVPPATFTASMPWAR